MKNLLIIVAILFTYAANSQERISLDQAIAVAMEQNYDIRIYDNNLLQAENNQNIKNTGYLPTVGVNAGGNYANNNAFLVTQDGEEMNINGIQSTTYNASIGVNYVLYSGMFRKNNFEKLKKSYELASLQRENTDRKHHFGCFYNLL